MARPRTDLWLQPRLLPMCGLALPLAAVTAALGKEVLVDLPAGGKLGLSTRGPSAFRVRVLLTEHEPIDTPMVAPGGPDAPFRAASSELGSGISAAFGAVAVSGAGALVLTDAGGRVLTESAPLGPASCAGLPGMRPRDGWNVSAAAEVGDEAECCTACSRAPGCTDWSFRPGGSGGRCEFLANVTRWTDEQGSVAGRASSVLSLSTRNAKLYGRGSGPENAQNLTESWASALIVNRASYVPHYYSTDGYAALGVVNTTEHNLLPVTYSSDGQRLSWGFAPGAFELYLMPAASLAEGTRAYFALTGAPRVPPLYAFGFIASRWGWSDRAYIDQTLATFRSGQFPIDAFIVDFEWFANQSDYALPPEGAAWYDDFGYNPVTFPSPREQFDAYHAEMHVRFGGIRKPRLGNSQHLAYARAHGWMAPEGGPETYADGRWLNFDDPAMRAWYGERNAHYLEDGVDFWWNDEGENGYFTYHGWNAAQLELLRRSSFPDKRFYSLNRAFTPGMARLGATVWTGDIKASWEDLTRTPGMMLNWGLAGAPYVSCDIGGFWGGTKAKLLARWYQLGTFMPTMRVHSTHHNEPHWPWLFGEELALVMRQALELRYRLVPYHYSLAHRLHAEGALWVRPMVMDFPNDTQAADLTQQWLDGQILAAPVLREDSYMRAYLPEGSWYRLGVPGVLSGPALVEGPAELSEAPAFVRQGTVLPLAPVVQHTGALPGGPLEVQVYAGANGTFDLVQDDGETVAYEDGLLRVTRLVWDDAARTLTWSVRGLPVVPKAFTELCVTLFDQGGVRQSATVPLAASGAIHVAGAQPQLRSAASRDAAAAAPRVWPAGLRFAGAVWAATPQPLQNPWLLRGCMGA